jgi:hypothetical protein
MQAEPIRVREKLRRISKEDASLWLVVQAHLRKSLGRPVAPVDFVDYADGKKGPHVDRVRALLWYEKTDTNLARLFRIHRAAQITRFAFIVIQPTKGKPQKIRALLSVSQPKVTEGGLVPRGFVSVAEISQTKRYREEVIRDAQRELFTFQQKYSKLSSIFGPQGGRVLDVIAAAIKQLEELKK